MFDFFKKREHSNVLKFPETKVPYVEPPKKEQEHYSIGITDDNRITLRIGYTTLTMNEQGVLNLIEALELFAKQTRKETETKQQSGQRPVKCEPHLPPPHLLRVSVLPRAARSPRPSRTPTVSSSPWAPTRAPCSRSSQAAPS